MPSRNTFFKPRYTERERNECIEWFEAHMSELPKSMLIDESVATNDLPTTVNRLIAIVRDVRLDQSTFCGYMSMLLRIRDHILNPKQ